MTASAKNLIALDVGEKRIGVASATTAVMIAIPLMTIEVDGSELRQIADIVVREKVDTIVVGYPRNQAGEPTSQTDYVETFAKQLKDMGEVVFQDESLTSVTAENYLKSHGKAYAKGDIDMQAAALILQDYLEINYAA